MDLVKLKRAEDEVIRIVDAWPQWTRAVAYRYLYNLGIRLDAVDKIIQDSLKEKD